MSFSEDIDFDPSDYEPTQNWVCSKCGIHLSWKEKKCWVCKDRKFAKKMSAFLSGQLGIPYKPERQHE